MGAERWGTLTPKQVSDCITFDRDRADWTYLAGDTSMPARQAEGVAGLWNKLNQYRAALLADEVGTGKTLQALGVMAQLWRIKPDARVLIMAPNRDICRHWQREYAKFIRTHYRESDGLVRRSCDGEPMHEARLVWSLNALAEAVEESITQPHQLFITTIYSLSGLVRGEHGADFDKLKGAAQEAKDIHGRLKKASPDGQGFDLLIVDEAHYFRNNDGKSQRAKAAREFFGTADDRLGARALLMTATPSHKSMDDITAILGYVADVGHTKPEELLKKYALRRLRRMKGLNGTYDKYSYRNELEVRAKFDDPAAELFFALYQKLLVEQQVKDGRRFLYGYLEGFESFKVQACEEDQDSEEDVAKRDFQGAPDTEILRRLARMHESLGNLPAHPKYDALVSSCVPKDVFNGAIDVHEHKHLVFVRRIPSVREIANRINTAYDKQMGRRIVEALAPEDHERTLKKWETRHWSRVEFNRLFESEEEVGDAILLDGNDPAPDEHSDADDAVYSKVANLFVVKKTGAHRSTDCSNFSLRLRKPESLFSLLLEPASDYQKGTYLYYYRKRSSDRLRDEYASAALEARGDVEKRGGGVVADSSVEFENPMPTLWGLMYCKLEPASRQKIELLARNPALIESFGHYLKNGYLFASPVIVELYCWYAEFRRCGKTGDVQQRYLAFLSFIEVKLSDSLALAYFCAALETFEALCENWEDHWKSHWHVLTGLNSPAFYASGAVKDRQRLILGFNTPFYPNVLATTSVLQEGVNLHMQCRKVHHYGIAWTPGDNEQRVGRVDRLFGKVNAQLERGGRAELAIHYPYLAQSFDEEQLASFIREKYIVEERMDACRQSLTSAEIDLCNSTDHWTSYLRKPTDDKLALAISDPFPYDPKET
ncbi:DEAD/DEAH box helicase [Zoogloea oleivorans]|uniref:DEAD/DEAH box helicase n=1 Tax=Zoogloea oleivorans TaxID=1552750 RepID=A0A6C2CP63_9RHOO|nr:DEAD/DEAH box helicase family protein [Zoogloea oleivorans]TYC55212.1 DEAD/DEAH box helicase [Zoogloea oleivorans]